MKWKQAIAGICTGAMLISSLSGCGNTTSAPEESAVSQSQSGAEAVTKEVAEEVVDLEIWVTNTGHLPVEKDSPMYNFYKDLIGVGIIHPYVEWNGGTTYLEQLNLRIAAGEMPDMFLPYGGLETSLIENGALLDLTDLLPEYAPNLWNLIPEDVWNAMRAKDPSGEGRIYIIPNINDYGRNGSMIRQDWLDNLGLSMPTTQEEYVEVLRAFKNDDPNGNGIQDELPTGGRAEARWMEQLFGMYGVAMWEGYPEWDIYDGELTYSAVTSNMRDALEWIASLYAEGLLDPETLLNDKPAWDAKIQSDRVGNWCHLPQESYIYAEAMEAATGVQPDIAILPTISAPGYEGTYYGRRVNSIGWAVKNTDDEAKIQAIMKVFNAYGDQSLWQTFNNGLEGMHSEMVDGQLVRLPEDKSTQQKLVLEPFNGVGTADFVIGLLEEQLSEEREWSVSDSIRNIKDLQQYVKFPAGDGIPSSIYNDYPDIQNRSLYVEYASKIIVGEFPIEKFDEFVEQWYATGGTEVTKAAREWYDMTQQNN